MAPQRKPTPPKDADGDGLSDDDERKLGSSPKLADTDGDGLTDREERGRGTNPTLKDTDFDGLSDHAEVRLETDPRLWDSDQDGRSDGLEIAIGKTDPTWYDRHDGWIDGEHKPTVDDPDGDRLTLIKERELGTDPSNADTDGDGLGDLIDTFRGGNPKSPYSNGPNDKTTDLDDAVHNLAALRKHLIENAKPETIYIPGHGRMEWGPAERPLPKPERGAAAETPSDDDMAAGPVAPSGVDSAETAAVDVGALAAAELPESSDALAPPLDAAFEPETSVLTASTDPASETDFNTASYDDIAYEQPYTDTIEV